MKIEDLISEWEKDSELDSTKIERMNFAIARLHSKYWNYLIKEKVLLQKRYNELQELLRDKTEYYLGQMSQYEMAQRGWHPFPKKILKTDIKLYLESDVNVQKMKIQYALQKEKVEFLESVIKMIGQMPFIIKNAIDYRKFAEGGY